MKKIIFALMAFATLGLTSCTDDDNNDQVTVTYDFTLSASDYAAEGYWAQVYNTSIKNAFWQPDLITTHSASETEYNGVTYKSWKGFCPSKSSDKADHTGDDWTKYQWGAITGGGVSSTDYLLACWDVNETTDKVPEKVCCGFGSYVGSIFRPNYLYITNSTYGYWAMKKGTAFSRAFTAEDWCKVTIIGLKDTTITGKVDVYLANKGEILDKWLPVDLTPLGNCNVVYFQMSSSDSGQWGMNNPAYFCIDGLSLTYL